MSSSFNVEYEDEKKNETIFLLRNISHMINNISKKVDSIEFELDMIKEDLSKIKNNLKINVNPYFR